MRRKNEAGQALVAVAAAMVVLVGFAGLAVDMGMLRYQKRLQQSAADAAAIAGADDLAHPANGGVIAAAKSASATDGFADNGGGALSDCTAAGTAVGTICVQVSDPASGPTTGPHTGDPKYVEVYVAEVHPTYFMKIMGINTEVVTARAVATNTSGGPNSGCLYTLGHPGLGLQGVNINGNATLDAISCGILDNGNFDPTGGALTVTAGSFGSSGQCVGSGCGKGSVTCQAVGPCPTYNVPAAADPEASLVPPSQPSASASCPSKGACDVSTSGTQTLQPGTYSSITIGKNSTVTLSPGIYYINGSGGMQFNGSATVTGSGVMFYFTGSASINAVGGGNQVANIQLSAPTSGPYAGILMYQDPADTNTGPGPNKGPTLGGDDNSFFNGVLYFPSDQLMFFGNSSGSNCQSGDGFTAGIVVSDSLSLSGHPTVCLQGQAGLPAGVNPVTVATLVE